MFREIILDSTRRKLRP